MTTVRARLIAGLLLSAVTLLLIWKIDSGAGRIPYWLVLWLVGFVVMFWILQRKVPASLSLASHTANAQLVKVGTVFLGLSALLVWLSSRGDAKAGYVGVASVGILCTYLIVGVRILDKTVANRIDQLKGSNALK